MKVIYVSRRIFECSNIVHLPVSTHVLLKVATSLVF